MAYVACWVYSGCFSFYNLYFYHIGIAPIVFFSFSNGCLIIVYLAYVDTELNNLNLLFKQSSWLQRKSNNSKTFSRVRQHHESRISPVSPHASCGWDTNSTVGLLIDNSGLKIILSLLMTYSHILLYQNWSYFKIKRVIDNITNAFNQ